ncbi:MAG TPA: heme-binding protein [Ktedonobacteraceae bacterium]|nr:heme-binding protein [Ktedonobacteraceae bacterium]
MTTTDKPIELIRMSPDSPSVLANLGLLQDLAGTWQGRGFNLIARPDFQGNSNLYLQLNQTRETLEIHPIGSAIPNRGFGQDDITLFGLTYLEKIIDSFTGGALHIEPGIWVTQPNTQYPDETAPQGSQIIARMASIPHGNSVLAQGSASRFSGPPTLKTTDAAYAFSVFPSFNSTPFGAALPPVSPTINAVGSSEKFTAPALTPPAPPFTQYDLTVPDSATNPRTPFGTNPPDPPLPVSIDGVAMQDVINDPATLLQAVINNQVAQGHTFEGTVLNIATQKQLTFLTQPNKPGGPTVPVNVQDGAGGIENILFLEGGEPQGPKGPNAQTAQVYATFWIEKVHLAGRAPFMQLQYAQMTVLNFPILKLLPARVVNLGWPHISVATLRKAFF